MVDKSYSTIVLYIRNHKGLVFSGQNITLKLASQYFHDALAVLVRYNHAQKFLQYDSIMAKARGLIFTVRCRFSLTGAFDIPQYYVHAS